MKTLSRRGLSPIAEKPKKSFRAYDLTALRTRKVGCGRFPWKLERTTWPAGGGIGETRTVAAFVTEQEADAAQVALMALEIEPARVEVLSLKAG